MNNVITFFVDSVTWNSLGKRQAKISPTPFLDSLKNESITATKLYSHAPYTDAATRSLFTGRNCLDDFGYYFRCNSSPITHWKAFHNLGYETYNFHYAFYVIGDKLNESIDHNIYTSSFIYESEWGGMFKYYTELVRQRSLRNEEYILLSERIRLLFETWTRFIDDAINNPEAFAIHKDALQNYDVEGALRKLREERRRFDDNPILFIDDLLSEGHDNFFSCIEKSGIETYIKSDFIDGFIEKEYGSFLNRLSWLNFRANVFKSLPSLKRILYALKRFIRTKDSSCLMFLTNYVGLLTSVRLMRKRWKAFGWQTQHSAYTIYESGLKILRERKSSKPFYFFFDVEEPHNDIAICSYDIQDKDVVKDEMKVLNKYVNEIGSDFKGNLLYLLSLRYSDYRIQRFCESLKEMGLWDKTTILFIADHGSSYTFNPLHNNRVNCFDDECYHIPMCLRHPGFKGIEVKSYQYSKDVLPTLLDVLGFPINPLFKGKSMITQPNKDDYALSEYMGPGCPDMLNRRIWFSIRDKRYVVAYKVGIFEEFECGELAEVYDLLKDPDAFYNINNKIVKADIQYLLDNIKLRYEEIKSDTKTFVESLVTNNIKF